MKTSTDSTFIRDFNEGMRDEFFALFASDDNTRGTVSAVRHTTYEPELEPYAFTTLPFKAPSTPMTILLKQSTRPRTITSGEFTYSIKEAVKTWNENGVVRESNPFFGSVKDASRTQRAQAYDGKFVHSFQKSGGTWIAGNWMTYLNYDDDPLTVLDTEVLVDSDVIYNTRYTFDTVDTVYNYNTNPKKIADLQSIALHELGHNVGLGDIYDDPSLNWDDAEIMNFYVWGDPQWNLGPGDLAGLKAIYG